MSQNWLLWKRSLITGGGIIGSGVLLYIFTTPTEEQLIAKLSPELRADYERNKELRRKEQEMLMEIVKQTAASNDPVWKTGPIASPWDRDFTPSRESLLVKRERFEKEQAEKKQREELERLKAEARLVQADESKSSGWKFWKKD
ncbi:hypothetical protein KL930_004750 [Ogataea haglerorum]|uniref:Cytochrome b mRNA-processing protein 4 n=1 Tax=Ogataea haglerorum TaxID=1937702 RepID=A0AAN6D2B8_9ASCO|nr:uncharacterized protein KL911_004481 [Ogataea haglerorum]KAG7693165.1 hypothetical protein KL951_004704 [Ogataea haglerorum]KAG7693590.1 hypothetical protein KL915_003880 [Ogataea haglerorum]KAG7703407.1 hypothetical protein KL914_004792 [Ogataea haglerorum]KAG7703744.1 hypothetical protein KL950_004541 [Ogataea haglerorum]KAG7714410.1 hypothetical protein KL913_004607 [Ogataea haglerorum]